MMGSKYARLVGLQSVSLLVGNFLLLSIFAVHLGLAGSGHILPAISLLASAVVFRYVVVYHQFSRPRYRTVSLVPATAAFCIAGITAFHSFPASVSLASLRAVFSRSAFTLGSATFLPDWWIATILGSASLLMILGVIRTRDLSPYPKPTEIRAVAASPAYFGFVCTVFGLWAVLFVGIGVQRVVVVAPLFEELLKFGVAVLVGSVLFDRSVLARIGVALVVGALFGLVEHATTYPMESDTVYAFRTIFHSTTTVLSVTLYTVFETRGANTLQWLAPSYAVMLHFFYNTFVVLSSVISVAVFGFQSTVPSLVYGSAAILLAVGLLVVGMSNWNAIVAIHRPLEQTLSDLF